MTSIFCKLLTKSSNGMRNINTGLIIHSQFIRLLRQKTKSATKSAIFTRKQKPSNSRSQAKVLHKSNQKPSRKREELATERAVTQAAESAFNIEFEALQQRVDPKTFQIKTWKSNRISPEQMKFATQTPGLPEYLYDEYIQKNEQTKESVPFFPSALFPHKPTTTSNTQTSDNSTRKRNAPPLIVIPTPINQSKSSCVNDSNPVSTIIDNYLSQPFSGLSAITPVEALSKAAESRSNKYRITETMKLQGSNLKKAKRRITLKDQAILQLQAMQDYLVDNSILKAIQNFPPLDRLHPFDRALIRLSLTTEQNYLKTLKSATALANRIKDTVTQQNKKIMAATSRLGTLQALDYSKKLILDSLAEKKEDIERLRELAKRLHHMPIIVRNTNTIDMDRDDGKIANPHSQSIQSVAVIGMPNSGKSTLINHISTGKPDIQNYSFTTKSVIVGHLFYENTQSIEQSIYTETELENNLRIETSQKIRNNDIEILDSTVNNNITTVQIMDTPGLLFRPDTYRKNMELLTLATLQHLNVDCIVFLLDLSCHCGYSIAEQLTVRNEIYTRYITHKNNNNTNVAPNWIDVISKVDIPINTYTPVHQFTYEEEIKGNKLDLYTDGVEIQPKYLKSSNDNNDNDNNDNNNNNTASKLTPQQRQEKFAKRQAQKEIDYFFYKQYYTKNFNSVQNLAEFDSKTIEIEKILPNNYREVIYLSISEGTGIQELKQKLLQLLQARKTGDPEANIEVKL